MEPPNFIHRLQTSNIALKSVIIKNGVLYGNIKILDIPGDKSVIVRWTDDNWSTITNTAALSMQDNEFSFCIQKMAKSCVKLAIQYTVGSMEYWDNNDYQDFTF